MPKAKPKKPAAPALRRLSLREAGPTYQGAGLTVDRAAWTVDGLKVLGLVSANSRRYQEAAVQAADGQGLYRKVKVNVDHQLDPTRPVPFQSRLGMIECRYVPGDGERGRMRINPKHPLAESFLWFCEHMPEAVGLSHNAEGDGYDDPATGELVVTKIIRVHSIDVVADPATTKGLHESTMPTDPTMTAMDPNAAPAPEAETPEGDETPLECVMKALGMLLTSTEEKDRQMARDLLAMIGKQAGPANGAAQIPETTPKPPEAPPASGDKPPEKPPMPDDEKKAKEYEEALKRSPTFKALAEQLDRYQVAEKAQQAQAHARKLCEAAHLPALLVTDVFLQSLVAAPDDAARKALVEDRKTLARGGGGAGDRPRSASADQGAALDADPAKLLAEFEQSVTASRW